MKKSISLEKYTNEYFSKYLEDNNIIEICYNGMNELFLQDAKGNWSTEKTELNLTKALAFATATASYKEDEIKESKPVLSAILNNGERVQIVRSPATKAGVVSITIRKPSTVRYTLEDYEKSGMFDKIIHASKNKATNENDIQLKVYYDNGEWLEFLKLAVKIGKNIVIAGATGSGKTTLMKSLIDFIPKSDRLITIEDVSEIKFYEHKNYVQLFYPSEAKQNDSITASSLLKSCLRMRPDRILLAELRGAETYDFLNVISSGHSGSITSCHAGSVNETFTRLGLMILQNPQGQKLPFDIIQMNLKESIDVVVHMSAHNGSRVITDIYAKGL